MSWVMGATPTVRYKQLVQVQPLTTVSGNGLFDLSVKKLDLKPCIRGFTSHYRCEIFMQFALFVADIKARKTWLK